MRSSEKILNYKNCLFTRTLNLLHETRLILRLSTHLLQRGCLLKELRFVHVPYAIYFGYVFQKNLNVIFMLLISPV